MFLNMASEATFLEATLDLKIKMVSEHSKNHYISITCVMPESTGSDNFIWFFVQSKQEMSLFQGFNMGCYLEFESQNRPKIQ